MKPGLLCSWSISPAYLTPQPVQYQAVFVVFWSQISPPCKCRPRKGWPWSRPEVGKPSWGPNVIEPATHFKGLVCSDDQQSALCSSVIVTILQLLSSISASYHCTRSQHHCSLHRTKVTSSTEQLFDKIIDTFKYCAEHILQTDARDPGLVYSLNTIDYMNFSCAHMIQQIKGI